MIERNQNYCLFSSDITCEDFDGEKVVLNLATGQYFSLNSAASALMDGLLSGCPLEALCQIAAPGYTSADALGFFESLEEQGLIRISAASSLQSPTDFIVELISKQSVKPALEAYSDLADLIIGDPVHETVEELGWPQMKAA